MQMETKIITLTGLVIREYPVGENDKFIHILTKERGVIEVSVRGGRKMISKNAGGSQLFAYSHFSIRCSSDKYYLDSSQNIRSFYGISSDLESLAIAQYIGEVVSYASGHNEQKEDVMRLILNVFHFLETGERDKKLLKAIFELRFISEIGMMPDIVCCSNCMSYTASEMCFDILSTKLYCTKCYSGTYDNVNTVIIRASVVHAMRHIVLADFDRLFNFRLAEGNAKRLYQLAENYLVTHLGRNFKTLEFYKSIS